MRSMGRPRKSNLNLPPRMYMKGDSYYHVVGGKWKPLGRDLNLARMKWAELEGEFEYGNEYSFAKACDRFIALKADSLADNTLRAYRRHAEELKGIFGKYPVESIKPTHIAQYLDTHRSKSAANQGKGMMSAIFSMAMRWGWCNINPCAGVEAHSMKPRERYITDAEFIKIRGEASETLKVIMDLAYCTSQREGDLLKIRLSDITDDGLYVKQGKTGKRIMFKWTPILEEIIRQAKALERPIRGMTLFCTSRGTPYNQRNFYTQWQNACRRAEIEDAHFHDIRAKAATDAKQLGQDYQALLGHANREMSDRYIKTREIQNVQPLMKKL